MRVVIDESSPIECTTMAIAGTVPGRKRDDHEQGPLTKSILITLAPGLELPFAEGDIICGSVRAFIPNLSLASDAFVGRPDGEVLLAYSQALPRDAPPVRGWTFAFGPVRPRPPVRDVLIGYDMMVAHDGAVALTTNDREFTQLRSPHGAFMVRAGGYRTKGTLSALNGYLGMTGYGFTIVRIRD